MVVGGGGDVLIACRCGKQLTGLRPRRLARLLLALTNLGGGGSVSRVSLGRARLLVVDRGNFLVALIPHLGCAPILDVEALHIAHMLALLYPELEEVHPELTYRIPILYISPRLSPLGAQSCPATAPLTDIIREHV